MRASDGRDARRDDLRCPGDVHSALIARRRSSRDPYVGTNELDVRWVADNDWLLSARLRPCRCTGAAHWYLDIDGLDTVAEVTLNGTPVLVGARTPSAATGPM